MTRRSFLKKYFWRFAVSLTLAGLIVYTVYHVLSTPPPQTSYAMRYTDIQILGGEAYLFREEAVLSLEGDYLVSAQEIGGEKVSKGVSLVKLYGGYSPEELYGTQIELDQIDRMIAVLEESELPAGSSAAKASYYRSLAQQELLALQTALKNGSWSSAREMEDRMLAMMNRYRLLIDPDCTVPETLERLREEKNGLLRTLSHTFYNDQSSGYFYDRTDVDGYEDIFTLQALEGLNPNGFAELKQAAPKDTQGVTVAGKMVYGNRWYLAIELTGDAAAFLKAENAYTFHFPENGDKEMTLLCQSLCEENGKLLAIFQSDEVPREFDFLRRQKVEITVGSCTGYYVPESAMHRLNGANGVYVFEDRTAYFRRVDVLYRGDGYYIVAEKGERGDEYLDENDLFIISGENLYDGRRY